MRVELLAGLMVLAIPTQALSQEIVKVQPDDAHAVSRPDDLFALPPDQWHMANHLSENPAPCAPDQCEAGFTSGSLVVSIEHSGEFVRIIAGFRDCQAVGSSEVEVGKKPGKPTFGRVRDQMKRVVKGVSKTCNVTAPPLPDLDIGQLFRASPVG
jgi:hypothetical protein